MLYSCTHMATVGVKGVYSIEQLLPAANLLNEILQKSEDTVRRRHLTFDVKLRKQNSKRDK